MWQYIDKPVNLVQTSLNLEVRQAIERWEQRITVLSVQLKPDYVKHRLIIHIMSIINESNTQFDTTVNLNLSSIYRNTGVLYAGGLASPTPPVTEAEVKGLTTAISNPQRGRTFKFDAAMGTMTVCIVVPYVIGKPQRIQNLDWGYSMSDQFTLSQTRVNVDGVLCGVFYYTGLVPFSDSMSLEVTL